MVEWEGGTDGIVYVRCMNVWWGYDLVDWNATTSIKKNHHNLEVYYKLLLFMDQSIVQCQQLVKAGLGTCDS